MDENREEIYLKADDDVGTIIRRIKKSQGVKIELILPSGMVTLRDEVNLRLLKFYVDDVGKEITLITDDPKTARAAAAFGFKVTRRLQEPQDVIDIQTYRRDVEKKATGGFKFVYLLIIILVLIPILFYAFTPRVTILLRPVVQEVTELFSIKASPSYKKVSMDELLFPAKIVNFTFEVEAIVPATGKKAVGQTRASGSVTFINQGKVPVDVPGGTLLATAGGGLFRTSENIKVPASTAKYLGNLLLRFEAGQASVPVEAEEKGTRGNVEPGKISLIVDSKWPDLQVVNQDPIIGGTDQVLIQVSRRDLLTARDALTQEIKRQILFEMASSLKGDDLLLEKTIELEEGAVIFNREVDEIAPDVTATTFVTTNAFILNKGQLEEGLGRAFVERLGADEMAIGDTLEVCGLDVSRIQGDTLYVDAHVVGKVQKRIERAHLIKEIIGREAVLAQETLGNMESIGGVEAILNKKEERIDNMVLPRWPFWIKIVVTEPQNIYNEGGKPGI